MHGVQDFVSEAIAFASKITETFTLLRLNLRSHPLATFSPCERLSHSDESHSELSNARTATFVSQSRTRNVADLGAVHTSAVRFTWDRSKSKAMWIVLDSRSKRVWDRSKRVWTLSQSKPGSIWDRPRLHRNFIVLILAVYVVLQTLWRVFLDDVVCGTATLSLRCLLHGCVAVTDTILT